MRRQVSNFPFGRWQAVVSRYRTLATTRRRGLTVPKAIPKCLNIRGVNRRVAKCSNFFYKFHQRNLCPEIGMASATHANILVQYFFLNGSKLRQIPTEALFAKQTCVFHLTYTAAGLLEMPRSFFLLLSHSRKTVDDDGLRS